MFWITAVCWQKIWKAGSSLTWWQYRTLKPLLCMHTTPCRWVQSNPAISNSVNSKSPLFRRKIQFPWIYYYVFSRLLSAISDGYLIRIPRYFELIALSLHLKSTPLFRTCHYKTEDVLKSTAGNVLHFIWARVANINANMWLRQRNLSPNLELPLTYFHRSLYVHKVHATTSQMLPRRYRRISWS